MTLKSLNTRYVKLIGKIAVMAVGLLAAVNLFSPTAGSTGFSLFVEEQKLTASDGGFGDEFGHSIAVSGSTVVVGARTDTTGTNQAQGAVYVFNRQGGDWVEAQKLTASDGAVNDQFGISVAVSGSTIVVGAWLDDVGGNPDQGAAYVFNRQGGTWVETQKLTASDGAAVNFFGWSVAASGTTIVVGANANNSFQGAAYVFNRQGGSFVEEQKLSANDGAAGDQFGFSVAISGSTVIVGAISDTINAILAQGSVYVFNRQAGSWVETQKLTTSDGGAFDLVGWSVAINGSTLVVSARADPSTKFDQGSAYVFNRQGGSWVEEQKLTASDGSTFDEFGHSVAISGSIIVVGARVDVIGATQGSAYIFNRERRDWVETQKLTASDGGLPDFFGHSVAISGSTIVVGAVSDTIGGNFAQGSVYVFGP